MKYHRKSIRLNNYDYSHEGYYFLTICCQNRINYFCNVGAGLVPALKGNKIILNDIGVMVEKMVLDFFNKNEWIDLDEFIIMPDHIHMIVVIKKQKNNGVNNKTNIRAGTRPAPTLALTLGMAVGGLKSLITNEYIRNIKKNNWPRFNKRLWQRNYYERIIRNEKEYLIYKNYIKDNPENFDNKKSPKKEDFNV